METVAAFFAGNPFATPIGQRIERATDASMADEDWALNMEICDLVNEIDEGPRDAVRAIKKRLQLNAGKNHTVVMHTLIVLETCVKNCGRRFHVLTCSKEFIQELVKLIGPKNDPPTEVQEKVLTLIQSWSDAFQQYPELQGVAQVYQELKSKGIEFPMTNLDTMAPILTPQKTLGHAGTGTSSVTARPVTTHQPPAVEPAIPTPVISEPLNLTETQLAKLHRELSIVEGNMAVLSEMLAELNPGDEQPADLELLRELYGTCRAMQQRLVELVDRVAGDELTAHLLKLNDDLNNLFLRYERYEKNRQAAKGSKEDTPKSIAPPESPSLIDLCDDHLQPSASAAAAALPTINMQSLGGNTADESEFDMFAQSRTATYESSKQNNTGGSYGDPDQLDASLGVVAQQRQQKGGLFGSENVFQGVKDEDIAEMEAWLEKGPPGEEEATLTPAMKEYLRKRSAAAARDAGSPTRRHPDNDPGLFSL